MPTSHVSLDAGAVATRDAVKCSTSISSAIDAVQHVDPATAETSALCRTTSAFKCDDSPHTTGSVDSEIEKGTPAPAPLETLCNGGNNTDPAASQLAKGSILTTNEEVVDRKDISLANISQMRLDGCRQRRLVPSSSMSNMSRLYGTPPTLAISGIVLGDGCEQSYVSRSIPSMSPVSAKSQQLGFSHGRAHQSAYNQSLQLDTSMAILERMAHDSVFKRELPTFASVATAIHSPVSTPRRQPSFSSFNSARNLLENAIVCGVDSRQDGTLLVSSKQHRSLQGTRDGDNAVVTAATELATTATATTTSALLHRDQSASRISTSSSRNTHSITQNYNSAHVTSISLCRDHSHSYRAATEVYADPSVPQQHQQWRQSIEETSAAMSNLPPATNMASSSTTDPPLSISASTDDLTQRLLHQSSDRQLTTTFDDQGGKLDSEPPPTPSILLASTPNHDFHQLLSREQKEALTSDMHALYEEDDGEAEAQLLLPMRLRKSATTASSEAKHNENQDRPKQLQQLQEPSQQIVDSLAHTTAAHVFEPSSGTGFSPVATSDCKTVGRPGSAESRATALRTPYERTTVARSSTSGGHGRGDPLGILKFRSDKRSTVSPKMPLIQPFQTWKFPPLGRSFDSPFMTPIESALFVPQHQQHHHRCIAEGSKAQASPPPPLNPTACSSGSLPGAEGSAHTSSSTLSRPTNSSARDDTAATRSPGGVVGSATGPAASHDSQHCSRGGSGGAGHDIGICTNASGTRLSKRHCSSHNYFPDTVSPLAGGDGGHARSGTATSVSSIDGRSPCAQHLRPGNATGGSPSLSPPGHLITTAADDAQHQRLSLAGDSSLALSPASGNNFERAMSEEQYLRKLESVCAAFLRNIGTSTTAATASTPAPREHGHEATPCSSTPTSTGTAAASAVADATGGSSACNVGARRSSLPVPSPPHSLSISASVALGRSAGYYSFGNRLSISHPNRQAIHHTSELLGSMSHLCLISRGTRSGGGGGGGGGGDPGKSATYNSITRSQCSAATHATAMSERRGKQDMVPPAVLSQIKRRPLLQTTVFLQYRMERLREEAIRSGAATAGTTVSTACSMAGDGFTSTVRINHVQQAWQQCAAAAPTIGALPQDLAGFCFPTSGSCFVQSRSTAVDAILPTWTTPVSTNHKQPQLHGQCWQELFPDKSPLAVDVDNSTNVWQDSRKQLRVSQNQFSEGYADHRSEEDGYSYSGGAAYRTEYDEEAASAVASTEVTMQSGAETAHQGRGSCNISSGPALTQCPRFFRALTNNTELVRHVHSIDGVEREVDNADGDLVVYVGMRLLGWLEVVSLLGNGSFGQVFLCKDLRLSDGHYVHPSEIDGEDFSYWNCSHAYLPFGDCDVPPTHNPLVAVKVVKSVQLFESQSVLEAEMLVLIGAQTGEDTQKCAVTAGSREDLCDEDAASNFADPPSPDPRCSYVSKVLADGCSYGHHCIVMERYGANLYEYIQSNNYQGLPMYLMRSIGRQILTSLTLLHEACHIIHADIKPENLMLTLDSCRSFMTTNCLSGKAKASSDEGCTGAAATDGHQEQSVPQQPQQRSRSDNDAADSDGDERMKKARHESTAGTHTEVSLEGSYIALKATQRGGSGSATTSVRRPTAVAVNEYSLKGRSLRELLDAQTPAHYLGGGEGTTAGEAEAIAVPEPRRMHPLNQQPSLLTSSQGHPRSNSSGGLPFSISVDGTLCSPDHAIQPSAAASTRSNATAAPCVPIPQLHLKLIDFSSSCYDGGPFYSYIQSRYYRAPEVIIAAPYNSGIDIWSTGCVLAELLLGMPLLPGSNDHHQLSLIEEMIGKLPAKMLTEGEATAWFYDHVDGGSGGAAAPEDARNAGSSIGVSKSEDSLIALRAASSITRGPDSLPGPSSSPAAMTTATSASPEKETFTLLSTEGYLDRHGLPQVEYTRYFTYRTLQELVRHCPLTLEERRVSNGLAPYVPPNEPSGVPRNATPSPAIRAEMMRQRFLLYDLLRALLNPNPQERPTAARALTHPFFTTDFAYMKQFSLEE